MRSTSIEFGSFFCLVSSERPSRRKRSSELWFQSEKKSLSLKSGSPRALKKSASVLARKFESIWAWTQWTLSSISSHSSRPSTKTTWWRTQSLTTSSRPPLALQAQRQRTQVSQQISPRLISKRRRKQRRTKLKTKKPWKQCRSGLCDAKQTPCLFKKDWMNWSKNGERIAKRDGLKLKDLIFQKGTRFSRVSVYFELNSSEWKKKELCCSGLDLVFLSCRSWFGIWLVISQ